MSLADASLADRYNSGKVDLSYLISIPASLNGLCKVFEYGAKKYARDNWKKGLTFTCCTASLLRHLFALMGGEDVDKESGCPHVDHVAWNALVLSEMFHTRKDMDDRVILVDKVEPNLVVPFPTYDKTIFGVTHLG